MGLVFRSRRRGSGLSHSRLFTGAVAPTATAGNSLQGLGGANCQEMKEESLELSSVSMSVAW